VDITDRDNPTKLGDVRFLSPDEELQFNDCGYYFYEIPPSSTNFFDQLMNLFCGRVSVTPAAGLGLMMWFMKARVSRKTRRVSARDRR
jgi:hypothetical protein